MTDFIKKCLNYETISYVIVGVLTTLVDYAVFALVNETLKKTGVPFGDPVLIATAAAWAAAVLFAYVANKTAVFRNYDFSPSWLIREFSSFVGARLFSAVLVMLFMWLTVSCLGWNEYLAKILSSVFNLVFNYAASKFFIFKK